MKLSSFLLLIVVLISSSCGIDTCDQDLDAINALRTNLELAPTQQSCFQLKNRIEEYLEDCDNASLESYVATLDCANFFAVASLCNNGIKDGLETEIDCGGFCGSCEILPTCDDGIQNGNETGIDCGGSCEACIPEPTCTDGIFNGDEIGIDCGGSCPDTCSLADLCSDGFQNNGEEGVDCGGLCPNDCPVATCTDNMQNGNETGVDCGGPDCPACPTCTDGIQNGNETGTDCGGSCPVCPPTCTDGIMNGNETGIDCGGTLCAPCQSGPTCNDGIMNGNETGIDCGGSCTDCGFFFTCKIDGVTYNGNIGGSLSFDCDYSTSNTFITGNAGNIPNIESFLLDFTIDPLESGRTYTFMDFESSNDLDDYLIGSYWPDFIGGQLDIYSTFDSSGTITITEYNAPLEFVSGNFEFIVIDNDSGLDTVVVTEGAFKIPFEF